MEIYFQTIDRKGALILEVSQMSTCYIKTMEMEILKCFLCLWQRNWRPRMVWWQKILTATDTWIY